MLYALIINYCLYMTSNVLAIGDMGIAVDALERKLTAIMYADVVGFSRLIGEDEEAPIGFSASVLCESPSWFPRKADGS